MRPKAWADSARGPAAMPPRHTCHVRDAPDSRRVRRAIRAGGTRRPGHGEPARGVAPGSRIVPLRGGKPSPWTRSIQVHELVQVEQRPAQLAQRRLAQERRRPLQLRRRRRRGRASAGTPARSARRRSSASRVTRSASAFAAAVASAAFSRASACGAVVLRSRLRAAQVAVRQVERLQERVPQVPPGEQVHAPADVLAAGPASRPPAATRRPRRPRPAAPRPGRPSSGSAGRSPPAARRGPPRLPAAGGSSATGAGCPGPSPRRRGGRVRRLLIRLGQQHQPVHRASAASRPSAQLGRQPVEQLRVRRPFAADAEVARRRHEARGRSGAARAGSRSPGPSAGCPATRSTSPAPAAGRCCRRRGATVGRRRLAGRQDDAGTRAAPRPPGSPARRAPAGASSAAGPGRSVRPIATGSGGRLARVERLQLLLQRRRASCGRRRSAPSSTSAARDRDLLLGLGDEFLLAAGPLVRPACGGRPAPPADSFASFASNSFVRCRPLERRRSRRAATSSAPGTPASAAAWAARSSGVATDRSRRNAAGAKNAWSR